MKSWMAVLTLGLAVVLLAAFSGPVPSIADTANGVTADAKTGKAAFMKNKCNSCHSIKAASIKRKNEPEEGETDPPDLSKFGSKSKIKDLAGFGKFLRKKMKLDGKKHGKKYKGSDDDLKVLYDWLKTLK